MTWYLILENPHKTTIPPVTSETKFYLVTRCVFEYNASYMIIFHLYPYILLDKLLRLKTAYFNELAEEMSISLHSS